MKEFASGHHSTASVSLPELQPENLSRFEDCRYMHRKFAGVKKNIGPAGFVRVK